MFLINRKSLKLTILITLLFSFGLVSLTGCGKTRTTQSTASFSGEPPIQVTTPTLLPTPTLPPMYTNPFAGPVPEGAVARIGKGQLSGLEYSPDGKILAISSLLGVYFYSASTFNLVSFLPTESSISHLAFSPDGHSILTSSYDENGINIWDIESGVVLQSFSGQTGYILSVAFSPDGQTIASSSSDGTIFIWDLDNTGPLFTLVSQSQRIDSVNYSPDGMTLASGSGDGKIYLWDIASGTLQKSLTGHYATVDTVLFSPDGKTLASNSVDNQIILWDVGTGSKLFSFTGRGVAFSPDGLTLASGPYPDSMINFWNIEDGSNRKSILLDKNWVMDIAFSPDGHLAGGCVGDGTVTIWDVDNGIEQHTFEGFALGVEYVAMSSDGKTLAGSAWDIKIWDFQNKHKLLTIDTNLSEGAGEIAFSPDGLFLASSGSWTDNTVILWEISTGAKITSFPGFGVEFSPDGLTIAIRANNRLNLYEISTGKILHSLPLTCNGKHCYSFSPDGKTIATGSYQGSVTIWDVLTGDPIQSSVLPLTGMGQGVISLAFSPDGKILACGGGYGDGTITLWNVEQGISTTLFTVTNNAIPLEEIMPIEILEFSPDGRILISGQGDGDQNTIVIWNVESESIVKTLPGLYSSFDFSPEGDLIATGSIDGTIILWQND